MYSITFVILPVTKTIFCTRGCFSASLGLKMNIDSLSWPYGHLRLSNLSFPALVTLENNHSYQKLFPTLGKWQMNEVKYYFIKPLTMRLCTLCKIVSMSKQYSGTVGLRTKINLATRYIIKGSFKPSQSETERHFFRHFCCVANL